VDRSTSPKPFIGATFLLFALFPISLVLLPRPRRRGLPVMLGLVLAFVLNGLREIGEPARKALITTGFEPHVRARGQRLPGTAFVRASFPRRSSRPALVVDRPGQDVSDWRRHRPHRDDRLQCELAAPARASQADERAGERRRRFVTSAITTRIVRSRAKSRRVVTDIQRDQLHQPAVFISAPA
jgi:hypothetical protein